MKKFIIPVTWSVTANIEIEADNIDDANDMAYETDLDLISDTVYILGSREVDYDSICESAPQTSEGSDK